MNNTDTESHPTVDISLHERDYISDFHCRNCGRMLFRAHIPLMPSFYLEIRCSRCNQLTIVRAKPVQPGDIRIAIQQETQDVIEPHERPLANAIHDGED